VPHYGRLFSEMQGGRDCPPSVKPSIYELFGAFLRFAQAAFIFIERAFFCTAVIGLRFTDAAATGLAAALAVLPAVFRFAAQKAFILSPCFFRCAAVNVRRFGAESGPIVSSETGRPAAFADDPKASIARFSLSRSKIKSVTMCSVDIHAKDSIPTHWSREPPSW